MALFDCQLDVLRMIVAAGDDDQVAHSARDVKLSIEQETEIARAQERTFTSVRKAGVKPCLGLVRTIPVTERDTRPADPYLANSIRRAFEQRFRIDDPHRGSKRWPSIAHQRMGLFLVDCAFDDAMLAQHVSPQSAERRLLFPASARHHQRRFGETVTRTENHLSKTVRLELPRELFQRLLSHRLRAVHGPSPTAEIQTLATFRFDLADAMSVSEV